MADKEFEEFTDNLDSLPSHIKGAASNYTLVPAITPLEENISFLEKVQLGEKLCGITEEDSLYPVNRRNSLPWKEPAPSLGSANPPTGVWSSSDEDEEDEDGVESLLSSIRWKDSPTSLKNNSSTSTQSRPSSFETFHGRIRRRKLPEIPKNRRPLESISKQTIQSIHDEISQVSRHGNETEMNLSMANELHMVPASLILNLVKDDLDVDLPCDVDSGNSTNHSPDDAGRLTASHSETMREVSAFSPISPGVNPKKLELVDPTHRGLHRFFPRHKDEIEIDIGDPVYVQKEAEDLWCEGVNLRTGDQGIFPLAHVVDVEYNDFDPNLGDDRKERYLLDYLGSVESSLYKGNAVLCQAVRKIVSAENAPRPHTTVLEISDKGIKMVDKTRPSLHQTSPCHDYFYSLKNVTFCGFHPIDSHFFGFVTKHPRLPRYACHVFVSDTSTQHIAEACGRAFSRFYKKFMDTAYPIEDIYLE